MPLLLCGRIAEGHREKITQLVCADLDQPTRAKVSGFSSGNLAEVYLNNQVND